MAYIGRQLLALTYCLDDPPLEWICSLIALMNLNVLIILIKSLRFKFENFKTFVWYLLITRSSGPELMFTEHIVQSWDSGSSVVSTVSADVIYWQRLLKMPTVSS